MTALLAEILDAQGGADRWRSTSRLVVRADIGGELWGRRGQAGALEDAHIEIWTHEQRLVFHDLGELGRQGVYSPERVEVIGSDGATLLARDHAGARFAQQTRGSAWDDLDLVYNAGFDLWHALTGPFALTWPGVTVEEVEPREETGELWRRLRARFPDDLVAHAREQTYAFDEQGRLRRFEYDSERPGVPASINYTARHREFGGLLLATRRRMLPAAEDGMPRREPVLMAVDVSDVQVA